MADKNIARSNKPHNDLTAEFVRSILDYDPATGALSWKHSPGRNNPYVGKPITSVSNRGYSRLGICGHRYLSHRIIWLLMTGTWPSDEIDHISGVRNDNRWVNLRGATHVENGRNSKISTTNTSGSKGVHWDIRNNKWQARILLNGKRKNLGRFTDIKAATAVYENAAAEFFGEFKRRS